MPTFHPDHTEFIRELLKRSQRLVDQQLLPAWKRVIPTIDAHKLYAEFFVKMQQLTIMRKAATNNPREGVQVNPDILPLLKAFFLRDRFEHAAKIEDQRSKTINPDVIEFLEEQMKPFNDIMRVPWFRDAVPEHPPAVVDVLSLEEVENSLAGSFPWHERQYDEKFHLLQAPSLFLPDLRFLRRKCELRGISVSVVFIDIDKFKDVNSEAGGETNVDRHVLPVFMRALEAHVFGRGHAYRFGGDEYALRGYPKSELS